MPYVPAGRRSAIRNCGQTPKNSGELTFAITDLVKTYLDEFGECFARFNEVIGALECAQFELYRRRIGPYEDGAIQRNGDLWTDATPQPDS